MSTSTLNPERAGSEAPNRRKFLALLSTGALAVTAGVMTLFNAIFLKPRVTYGPPPKFRVGLPNSYTSGSSMAMADKGVVVRRDGDRFSAISLICTHLGCLVTVSELGFECPCHGSSYDQSGEVIGGPAPTPLNWYQISVAPNGELEVDTTKVVPSGTYMDLKAVAKEHQRKGEKKA
jgi:cytochrome b6-f complex iron-sulfur subunit